MIDIEPVVYTRVHDAIITAFPGCTVSDVPPEKDASFPFVVIREESNRTYRKSQDNALIEHHATIVYEVSVYSNKQTGRKQECKRIMDVADLEMQGMKFTRVQRNELPTIDRTIMRLFARYEAVVEAPEEIDGNTVYQMYRR
ncbi:MAG: hypothetical protein II008_17960 [Oscillospiraceae bacterium]|nr:hypothetical protein [Oscillospiraceae bacterium]